GGGTARTGLLPHTEARGARQRLVHAARGDRRGRAGRDGTSQPRVLLTERKRSDMGLDIRTPIGALFTVLGSILALFGLFTVAREEMYVRSLGINMNLWWGLVMAAFGLLMLLLGRNAKVAAGHARQRTRADTPQPPGPQSGPSPGSR